MRISGRAAPESLRLMAGASGVTTLGALPPFLLGAQGVWVREDLGIGLGLLGAAVSLFFASAAVGSVVMGTAFDRLGRRRGLLVAATLVVAGGLSMALLVSGTATLLATMVVLGLGNASCQTAANVSMARALPPHRRGLGFGVKQSAVPLAITLGGLAVPTLGGLLGWRSTFVATAIAGLLLAAGTLRRSPAYTVDRASVDSELDRPPWRPLLLCGLGITLASASANFLGAFVASWGFDVGMSATATGLLMAAGSSGSIAIRVLAGWRADGRQGANLPVVAFQMLVGAVGVGGLTLGTEPAVIGFGLLALSVGWAWPGLLLYAVARLGRDTPARASGVVQGGAFTGGALGPLSLGALAQAHGFPAAWTVSSVLFVLGAAAILWARTGFRADLESRPPRVPLAYGGGRRPRRA